MRGRPASVERVAGCPRLDDDGRTAGVRHAHEPALSARQQDVRRRGDERDRRTSARLRARRRGDERGEGEGGGDRGSGHRPIAVKVTVAA